MSLPARFPSIASRRRWAACLFAGLTLAASTVSAATLPSGFSETVIASGISNPTAMAFAPDGRLFVCEQGGRLRVIKNGALLATPFLTVTVSSVGERGLLGVAFDPQFATNQFVYVYYTATSPAIHNRVSRFTANGDVAVAGSELQLLNLNNLSSATNHNGGAIHFGPDGRLFIAVGENANGANAQSLNNLLGKMLRINRDGTIPTDNPFFNTATGVNRAIWALGLRNPFTFTFQPGSSRMLINDVGEVTWEEIDEGVAGSNYGWPTTEGPTTDTRFRSPIFAYQHGSTSTTGCAITGGLFYNPATQLFPASFNGSYFFADFCSGWIRRLPPPATGGSVVGFASGISSPVDLQLGPDGALYYLARGNGSVVRVQFTTNSAPAITDHPDDLTVAVGQPATFRVSASGVQPLRFQWQRNGTNIPGATSSTFTLASPAAGDNGAAFRAVVTNDFGSATSNAAILTVTGNSPPTGTITTPANGTLYRGGETFTFAGTATDPEDGNLGSAAFTWQIDFHHADHTHPFLAPTSGITSGSFTIPTRGETATNVFFRVLLTVRDSGGLTRTTFVDLVPRTSTITLATQPAGLQVTLDGQPVTTPFSQGSVEGVIRTLGVVSPQTSGGTTFNFVSWSDGGAATHEISTPLADTTFTATYQAAGAATDVFLDQFGANTGWVTNPNGNDTATTGAWQRGDTQATTSGGVALQLGACDAGTVNCMATGLTAGASAGANDVDGGVTTVQSPAIALPATGTLTLSFAFYFSHLNNSSADDFFRVRVVGTSSNTIVFQELGTAANDAAVWATRSVDISSFAGQTIRIVLEAADNAGGSLVEAAVDTVRVTRQ